MPTASIHNKLTTRFGIYLFHIFVFVEQRTPCAVGLYSHDRLELFRRFNALVRFLQQRKDAHQEEDRPTFPLGIWNGGLLYMSDDFNETPEGFEDYT